MSKVKMTNADVVALAECLNALCDGSVKLKPRTWFKLSKSRRSLIEQGKLIDESSVKISDKHKVKGDDGNYIIPEKKVAKFQEERMSVLTMDVEIDLETIQLSEIEKEMPKLTGIKNLFSLFDFIIEEDKPKKK